jgi:predicted dehydrogenase
VRSALFRRVGAMPPWSWQNWFSDSARSGGAALDLHVHDVDLVQWFFGLPEALSAVGTTDAHGGVNYIFTQYRYGDGPAVAAEGGWLPGPVPFRMGALLQFESATVEYDTRQSPALAVYRPGEQVDHPSVPPADGYAEELRYFAECVSAGRKPERVSADDAVRAVKLVEAEVKSVQKGRPVKVQRLSGA